MDFDIGPLFEAPPQCLAQRRTQRFAQRLIIIAQAGRQIGNAAAKLGGNQPRFGVLFGKKPGGGDHGIAKHLALPVQCDGCQHHAIEHHAPTRGDHIAIQGQKPVTIHRKAASGDSFNHLSPIAGKAQHIAIIQQHRLGAGDARQIRMFLHVPPFAMYRHRNARLYQRV